jgi:hypothetical protein
VVALFEPDGKKTEVFLAKQAQQALSSTVDLLLLTFRPLFGLQHADFPEAARSNQKSRLS